MHALLCVGICIHEATELHVGVGNNPFDVDHDKHLLEATRGFHLAEGSANLRTMRRHLTYWESAEMLA